MKYLLFWTVILISPSAIARGEYSNGAIGFSIETPSNWEHTISPEQGAATVPLIYTAKKSGENHPGDFAPTISVFFVPLSVYQDSETGRYTELHLKQQAILKPELVSQTESLDASGLTRIDTKTKFEFQAKKGKNSVVQEFHEVHRDGFAFVITSSVTESAKPETIKEIQGAINSISIRQFDDKSYKTFPAHQIARNVGLKGMTSQSIKDMSTADLFAKGSEEQQSLEGVANCIQEIDMTMITDLHAAYLGKSLRENYEDVLEFTRSEGGDKYINYYLRTAVQAGYGLGTDVERPEFTAAQIQQVNEFIELEAGGDADRFFTSLYPLQLPSLINGVIRAKCP